MDETRDALGPDERTKSELARAQLLLSALGALAGSLDLAGVLTRLVDILHTASGHARSSVLLWNEEASELELAASVGVPVVDVGRRIHVNDVSRSMRDALDSGSPVIADFTELPADETGMAGAYRLSGSMIVPMNRGGRLLGVVTVDELDPKRAFTEDEIMLTAGIATQAALAIENARLFEAQKEQAHISEVLAQISLGMTMLDFYQALPLALEQACAVVQSLGAVVSRRERGGWLTTLAYGDRLGDVSPFYSDVESPARRAVLETRKPYLVSDVLEHVDADRQFAQRIGYRSYIALPLLIHERVVGAISFFFSEPLSDLPRRSWDFLDRFQYIIAASLETQRLFEERAKHVEYAEALNRINEAIHSTLDFDEIMSRVVVDATRAAGMDGGAVHLHAGDRWRFSHTYGLADALRSAELRDEESPLSMLVVRDRSPVVLEDVANDSRANRALMDAFAIKALVGLPLFVRDEVVGVLFAGCYAGPQRFSEDQVDFMVKVAYTLSLALENSRLYQDEHRVAETLQHALVALPERVEGIDFASVYHSASDAAYVGGDFFDVFDLEGDLVGVLIGDIAGKGLDAAVLTSLVKNTIRAHASEKCHSPDEVARLTNDILFKTTEAEAFATVFFGVLDFRDGRLLYTNAGHTTGAILGIGGVRRLPANSPLVGAFSESTFRCSEAMLRLDEVLLLYTDGVTEARGDAGLYGETRLFELLARMTDPDPEGAANAVVNDVLAYGSGCLTDDLAVLSLERVASVADGFGCTTG